MFVLFVYYYKKSYILFDKQTFIWYDIKAAYYRFLRKLISSPISSETFIKG